MTSVDTVQTLFARLTLWATADYVGEPVSQLSHALQCAELSRRAGGDDLEILAALFHDVGHLEAPDDAPRMADLGVLDHERRGALFLALQGAPPEMCVLVAGHVAVKRYLVATNPRYANALSAASRGTLAFQGGPMSAGERAAFEAHPLREAMLRLRRFDEAAKDPAARPPDLESHRARILRVFRAPFSR
jgi:predicted HD phosphohydrolase